MTSFTTDIKATAPSERSHASSIRSIELQPTVSQKARAQNGSTTPPDAQSKQAEKTSVKDRITRMFSQRTTTGHETSPSPLNGNSLNKKTQQHPVPQQLQQQQQQSQLEPPGKTSYDQASSASGAGVSTPSTANSVAASPSAKPQAPSRKSSATDKTNEKAAAAPAPKAAKPGSHAAPNRYVCDPNQQGGHEHYLKSSRRQEKLMDMFRVFLGKKVENPDSDLSLVSSWVDNLKQEKDSLAAEKKAVEKKVGVLATAAQPSTLSEKYGKCQEIVGRGAFGIVRISHKKLADGLGEKLFAVKEFRRRPEENEKKYSKRLTSEFCISSSLRHPNVIHTLDLIKDAKGDYCEVMEFCAGGDLYTLVLAAGKLEVQEADCFFKQMMRGVEYMHEMGVAHRDLKPENLLLTTHGGLKITDFGNGECFRMAWESDAHMVTGLCGSAPYIAPEEYVSKEFDARAVDVWACGVIYMAMRTGRHLWRVARKDEDEFYARYLDGRRDEEGYGPIESLHRVSI